MSSSSIRSYDRFASSSSSSIGSSSENLPPKALSRVAREVRDLIKKPEEGVKLVVDSETGTPSSLAELTVRTYIAHIPYDVSKVKPSNILFKKKNKTKKFHVVHTQ